MTAIAFMLVASLMFTGIDTCAKWLVLTGVPAFTVVFVRYFTHLSLVTSLSLPSQRRRLFSTGKPWLEAARGASLLGATICNFEAVRFLPLTLTAAILFTVPLWICALSIPILGERVGIRRWMAILVGLCGAIIASRPWSAEFHWAVLFSFGAALCTAFYSILTRLLAGVDATSTQQFYAAMFATLGIAPIALLNWGWPAAAVDWLAFALIGLFGWTGHQFLTIAHRYAPASALAPFMYAQMIYMTASSWIVFHTPPNSWVLTGAALVLGAGFYVWLRERQLAKTGRTQLTGGEAVP
jgi:drug/metabolite transporter (DMT)-like permease